MQKSAAKSRCCITTAKLRHVRHPTTATEEKMAAKHDLTPRIAPHLDRHLVFPLLEFLQEIRLYPEGDILKAKIVLLNHTNMVDYAMDIHKSLYQSDDVPQGMLIFVVLWLDW